MKKYLIIAFILIFGIAILIFNYSFYFNIWNSNIINIHNLSKNKFRKCYRKYKSTKYSGKCGKYKSITNFR